MDFSIISRFRLFALSRFFPLTGILSLLIFIPCLIFFADKPLALWAERLRAAPFGGVYRDLNPLIFIVTHGTTAVAVIAVFYLYGMAFNARVRAVATSMFIAFMVSGISVQLLKHLIGRARPRLSMTPLFLGPTIQPGFDSFPSGHTTVTFCMAYVLSQRVPRYRALYFAFAFFTALDRILGLAHFLSDVAAGIALGLAAGILVSEFIRPEGSPDGIFSKKTNPYPAAPNTDGPERSNAL